MTHHDLIPTPALPFKGSAGDEIKATAFMWEKWFFQDFLK
jgi:hypothetical protein